MMYSNQTPAKKWLKKAWSVLAFGSMLCVLAACSTEVPPALFASQSPDPQQQVFSTPEQAVDALIGATREDRKKDLLEILGPDAHQIIYSGDKVADKEGRNRFITAYDHRHEIIADDATHDTLVVGEEKWPLPIPLVQGENGWWFNTEAGQEEILNRRIGRNELSAIEVCRAYVIAQQEFSALQEHGKNEHEYAQRFQSKRGHHDGLYWPASAGEQPSPLGPLLASAAQDGYTSKVLSKYKPYHGYYYRILKSQGSHAAGGAKDYIVNGHMKRGFALIAFPDRYGDSGVMTFIVNQNGIVYEKNLGFDTAELARITREFDPDESWNIVQQ